MGFFVVEKGDNAFTRAPVTSNFDGEGYLVGPNGGLHPGTHDTWRRHHVERCTMSITATLLHDP
jgi:hypothetical protein